MQPTAPAFAFLGALTESIARSYSPTASRRANSSTSTPLSKRFSKETGRSPSPLRWRNACTPKTASTWPKPTETCWAGSPASRWNIRVLLPGGAERWLRVKPLLVEENGVRAIAGLAEDITDFKHYSEVELKFSHKKNAIIQMLSHDLAGPLGTIQSLSSLVATRIKGYKDEPLSNVVDLITETSRGALRLIRDFLEQEFLESSETALIKNRVNLVEKLTLLVEQYQASGQNSAKQFTLSSSDPSVYADVDEVKFMQVITNLVSNAIKFTADDGAISIRVDDQEEAGTVRDNGIGIPEKYHAALFDKFTKARRPGLRQEPSTGLGMSPIKTIVDWHKGKIWFESEENRGTTFFVEVPRE